MRGVIVFLAVFILVLVVSLGYSDLPPGRQIYNSLNVPTTDYSVLGLPATTLIVAIFNGVIYGVIIWLIYTIAERARKPKPQTPPQQQRQ